VCIVAMPESAVTHPADRLLSAIERFASPVCVGIDPVVERLPDSLRREGGVPAVAAAIGMFSLGVVEAVADIVPCVKIQSACFERYGHPGVAALQHVISEAKRREMEVILDAKRGDIGLTAAHYAAAAFDAVVAAPREGRADWITINSYLGEDGITPFLRPGHGAFALVRTSNPGGDAIQAMTLADGRTVAEHVAALIASIGESHLGERGYSALGAVVGATKPADAASLRALMPQQILLVPGYGAQGGGVNDVLPCFQRDDAGRLSGAIVTTSRSVIFAFDPEDNDWQHSISAAATDFAAEIGAATGWR
jgi:orotidine-5'-phosphate decarboxylase